MKYYLIAGEASGDLHASHLMAAIKKEDVNAEFRFLGGNMMAAVGGVMLRHYRDMAYMGFIPVLLHFGTILSALRECKRDILKWHPDVVILVDYPGFNLKIAKFVHKKTLIPVCYYISPKIWAWKEYRIKNIKRDVDALFSILPFEVEFFKKHDYRINYVGNPTVDEIALFQKEYSDSFTDFTRRNHLDSKPIIALLAGSRKQEISDNLPRMIEATAGYTSYTRVIAGAPGIAPDFYQKFIGGTDIKILFDQTYPILQNSDAALVTSGTATLETALFRVPQVVCYYMSAGKIVSFLRKLVLKVKYISLVNLIVGRELVKEFVADGMTVENIRGELNNILRDSAYRSQMLNGYTEMKHRLGTPGAAANAAAPIVKMIEK